MTIQKNRKNRLTLPLYVLNQWTTGNMKVLCLNFSFQSILCNELEVQYYVLNTHVYTHTNTQIYIYSIFGFDS